MNNEKEFKKLIDLKEMPAMVIFDELRELNGLLEKVIEKIEESKVTEVSVSNQEKQDLSLIETGLNEVVDAIGEIKFPTIPEVNFSGIEKLLLTISKKEANKIDLSELKGISQVLGEMTYAVQNLGLKEEKEPIDHSKHFEALQGILWVINENIVSIDIPSFDYERIVEAIKGIKISVSGPSPAGIEKRLDDVTSTTGLNNGLRVTQYDSFGYEDSNPKTAFGDLRVAELTPVLQFSFEYTVDNTELTTQIKTGSGTVTQADAMAVASTGTTTSSISRQICHQHVRYRAGLGGLMRFTALFTQGVANTSQWVGLLGSTGSTADFQNGFAVGYNGTTFGVGRFSNDSLTFTALSACDDPLDGTGKSGMTVDPTKLNVFFIQYQYLGAGRL